METLSSKEIVVSSFMLCNTQNIIQFIVLTRWQKALLTYPMTCNQYPSHCKQWENQGRCKKRRWKRRQRKYGWMMDVKIQMKSSIKDMGDRCEPIIEEPTTPKPESLDILESATEDAFWTEDPDEIPMIKLNIEEFMQNVQNYMQEKGELQDVYMSKGLVALTQEAATIPMPKLKNVNRLRTEHQVCELPDAHPLLAKLDRREPEDTCTYLLAIWTPGETTQSIQPPEIDCTSQKSGNLCSKKTCFTCNNMRGANAQTVRGTLLIPCGTAMRGSFPLHGTYFQDNEMVSAAAPVLLSKACELFIMELTQRSWLHVEEKKRRPVRRSDLGDSIRHKEAFHFLANVIPKNEMKDFISRLQEIFQQPMVQEAPMSTLITPTVYEPPQDFIIRPQEIFQQSMIQQPLIQRSSNSC